jgi:hypothetical protein
MVYKSIPTRVMLSPHSYLLHAMGAICYRTHYPLVSQTRGYIITCIFIYTYTYIFIYKHIYNIHTIYKYIHTFIIYKFICTNTHIYTHTYNVGMRGSRIHLFHTNEKKRRVKNQTRTRVPVGTNSHPKPHPIGFLPWVKYGCCHP